MGIFDSIGNIVRGQLIDVIEWTDSTNNTIVHKYDMNGKEIMMGAQLTVRESQVAIFVNEGKLADVFQPGRYELSTANMPVMTALKAWKFGFNSPFKSDVYFVNTKQVLDRLDDQGISPTAVGLIKGAVFILPARDHKRTWNGNHRDQVIV